MTEREEEREGEGERRTKSLIKGWVADRLVCRENKQCHWPDITSHWMIECCFLITVPLEQSDSLGTMRYAYIVFQWWICYSCLPSIFRKLMKMCRCWHQLVCRRGFQLVLLSSWAQERKRKQVSIVYFTKCVRVCSWNDLRLPLSTWANSATMYRSIPTLPLVSFFGTVKMTCTSS